MERFHDGYVVIDGHSKQVQQSHVKRSRVQRLDDHVETVRAQSDISRTRSHVDDGVDDLVDDV